MNYVQVKTDDLVGSALDWAVAQACGLPVEIADECCGFGVQYGTGSPPECCCNPIRAVFWKKGRRYQPSYEVGDAKACRIIVHASFGDTVSIPAELMP